MHAGNIKSAEARRSGSIAQEMHSGIGRAAEKGSPKRSPGPNTAHAMTLGRVPGARQQQRFRWFSWNLVRADVGRCSYWQGSRWTPIGSPRNDGSLIEPWTSLDC